MKDLPVDFLDQNVCILGMGYVGLTLSVAMALVGFKVHGIEVVNEVLESLKKGKPHFWEKGLEKNLQKVIKNGNFTFSKNLNAINQFSVYIITVGTPLGSDGKVRLDMIQNATKQAAEYFNDGALLLVRSTVQIGTTRNLLLPIMEATGKKFEIAVCPERTLEGNALSELRELPQIIGADFSETLFRAGQIFSFLTPTSVRVSSLETAEVVKLVDNSYRDLTFGFSNEVARLCDAVGVSAHEVIHTGKLDYSRTNVAMPGPVGGPCLSKDPHLLAESAKLYGIQLDIIPTGRLVNERQPDEVAVFIKEITCSMQEFPEKPIITLLGIAFKGNPENNDVRGSMAKPIHHKLSNKFPNAIFQGFDPLVSDVEIRKFGLEPIKTLDDAFTDSNIVLILNNHKIFRDMDIETQARMLANPSIIYDFWNLFNKSETIMPIKTEYYSLGSHKLTK